jgi:cytochrome b6-f complex iron-sulfur subunit
MSCEDCVNRREFFARSGLAAAATLVVTACGDGQIGPTAPEVPTTPSGGIVVRLADHPSLATVGGVAVIDRVYGVRRTGSSTFIAYSLSCTHAGCPTELRNNQWFCPCHASRFDLDGRVLAGPARRPLDALTTRYNAAAGTVTIGSA